MERSCYRIWWRRRIRVAKKHFQQDNMTEQAAAYIADLFLELPKIDGGWLRRKKMAEIDRAWAFMSAKHGGFDYKKTATWTGGGYGMLRIRPMTLEQLKAEYPNWNGDQHASE
jgi:hypothetical protein